jgi:hypothetical protein
MGDITIEKLGCQIKISHDKMIPPFAHKSVIDIHIGRERLTHLTRDTIFIMLLSSFYLGQGSKEFRRKNADL